ncbi:hypothetical protein BD289DRAFT_206569 [Coniella lustricola]|uniref:dolichol kinase n=1 Tax=Coniella lustricola TaxID=2025994 RepID=A0A2T3AC40_9PEZI|nr:hypothetical protein BD289DRAFT_206569 [Coniella lustricola]
MLDTLQPTRPPGASGNQHNDEMEEDLHELSRSPHPYHRQQWELLNPADRIVTRASSIPTHQSDNIRDHLLPTPSFIKEATPITDSGTEADDEVVVKKLPAPRAALHKGVRGRHEALSGSGTPLLTPALGDGDPDAIFPRAKGKIEEEEKRQQARVTRRNRELIRRSTEIVILGVLSWLVLRNPIVRPFFESYKRDLMVVAALLATLWMLYPLRVALWAHNRGVPLQNRIPISVPSSFDPAPTLYPQILPILVAFLTAANLEDAILPNLVLAIASLPRSLVPLSESLNEINSPHWLLTCLPLAFSQRSLPMAAQSQASWFDMSPVSRQDLAALYPLHQALCLVLYSLTTSSLLTAELQLLSISLINLLLLSRSPQAVILQSILWIGGLGVLVSCAAVIQWSINLARVPKWRMRRNAALVRRSIGRQLVHWLVVGLRILPGGAWLTDLAIGFLATSLKASPWRPWEKVKTHDSDDEDSAAHAAFASDEDELHRTQTPHRRSVSSRVGDKFDGEPLKRAQTITEHRFDGHNDPEELNGGAVHSRRRTFSSLELMKSTKSQTVSGRQKRRASSSVRFFYGLTPEEASARKWVYAAWVYASIVAVVLLPVGMYVKQYATDGYYPVGWAVGYVLGDIHWFRMQVVMSPWLDWLLALPALPNGEEDFCHMGWIEHLRHASIGEANTRLCLAAWWLGVIVIGLAVVFRLSPYYEVDTRRKIFHFMMVSMFLPAIFIDPTWCALALAIVLAIFLLLDLLRASQLPPLSKPIRIFLQPYTDGRDHQGPVVISHIFLLIGCAIPLWLSLASLSRTGTGNMRGWETPARELSMVAGVICVGLGDAAASLIGRRYGKHKWVWKGGKSLEGSVAFAAAVVAGLMAASLWLKLGGWPAGTYDVNNTSPPQPHLGAATAVQLRGFNGILLSLKEWQWSSTLLRSGFCASLASLTEAVLTGGNDNVIVPVVLWTCVKSTGL